ncbi:Mitochondrial escape protein 2 [Venturia nashicola]|uniref:Mitochondrial escape protein 2 n=1 Tax=Venturia nashicola TaxID=86259 RepID=A0A4Z1P6B2_9PEZI|nr:Mitochondrial escape protein 2 [Venturia nashicola]TLD31712.1 Mitochondrial escape protein 2 [Venturia nashicola]
MTVPTPTAIATEDPPVSPMDQQVTDGTRSNSVHQTETRPRKRQKPNGSATYHTATLRSPRWTYFHLQLFTSSASSSNPTADEPTLDAITVRRYLSAALSRFLGQMGSAIPVDILKIDQQHVWIRVPSDDATAVHGAMSSWVSNQGGMGDGTGVRWILNGRDDWLVRLGGVKGGQDLFAA